MPYERKPSAPLYSNLIEAATVAITGTPDAWIIPWFTNVPGTTVPVDVDAFCQAGPPAAVEFAPYDFLASGYISLASLGAKILAWIGYRMFPVYCQSTEGLSDWILFDSQTIAGGPDGTGQWGSERWYGDGYSGLSRTVYPPGTVRAGVSWFSPQAVYPQNGNFVQFGGSQEVVTPPLGGAIVDMNVATLGSGLDQIWGRGTPTDPPEWTCTIRQYYKTQGGGPTYTPEPLERPASAIAPPAGVYETIPDVGVRLDEMERKLHLLLDYAGGQTARVAGALVEDATVVLTGTGDVNLSPIVRSVILTCSTPFNSVDEHFAPPRVLHRMGRVLFGTGEAWSLPIDIGVSPLLLERPGDEYTVLRVQLEGAATVAVTTLVRQGL